MGGCLNLSDPFTQGNICAMADPFTQGNIYAMKPETSPETSRAYFFLLPSHMFMKSRKNR